MHFSLALALAPRSMVETVVCVDVLNLIYGRDSSVCVDLLNLIYGRDSSECGSAEVVC